MAEKRKDKSDWVSSYDSEIDRWVTWDEMQEDWYKEREARRLFENLHHPMFWVFQSNSLHVSALSLWKETENSDSPYQIFEQQKVALMLAGMSLECAIKARMMALCPFPLDIENKKRIFSGAHDLVILARRAGIRTNSTDRSVLNWLSAYIRWLGRYPTPKTADEMVRHWLGDRSTTTSKWNLYVRMREKLGKSLNRPLRDWAAGKRSKRSNH